MDEEDKLQNDIDQEISSLQGKTETSKKDNKSSPNGIAYPEQLYLLPLNRRPFFPGMAAPIVIEPGAYYEVLKMVSKTDCISVKR